MQKTHNDPARHIYDWERMRLDDEVHTQLLRETYSPWQQRRLTNIFQSIFNLLTWWRH